MAQAGNMSHNMKKSNYLNKESSSAPKILGLIILVLFVFTLGWHVGSSQSQTSGNNISINQSTGSTENTNVDMKLFWDVWSLLAGKYVDPQSLDFKEMVYGSIRGMVYSLKDPYTTFLTPKQNKNLQNDLF